MDEHIAQLLDYASKAGADHADALYVHGVDLAVACRKGQQEELERSESSGVGLRVWVGQRSATVSTSDMGSEALRTLSERAVAMARVATQDPYAALAPEERLARDWPDLELADTAEPRAESLLERAMEAEAAALAHTGITNSEGADASYGKTVIALGTSHGFYGSYTDTAYGMSASVLAGEGSAMERDYDVATTRFEEDLPAASHIGEQAAQRALKRLHPRRVATRQVPVVFEPRVGRSLLGSLTRAINGAAITRGTSFLSEAMHTALFPAGVRIVDDPLRRRGLNSQPFDAEGLPVRQQVLVEDGVLQTWLLDVRSANKLGLTSTGHAARGLGSAPSPSPTNVYMEPGTCSAETLIGDVREGLYVTEIFGMGVNLVTGDYSQGAAGFWIENGEIAYPVSELTIAGHLKTMYAHLTPADDLIFRYGTNVPTLRVDGMTVAGT